jgi:hypothetical protein
MNRKAFLTTVAALFTAPFLTKKKENEDWKKANPMLLVKDETSDLTTKDDQQLAIYVDGKRIAVCGKPYEFPADQLREVTIKDSNLQSLFDEYQKGIKS